MKNSKKSAKTAAVSTRGHAYELTAKGAKLDPKELGSQQAVIFPHLKSGNKTAAQIAAAVEGKLETKQDVQRVVAFYLGNWKKDGIVRFAAAAKAPKAKKAAKAAPEAVAA